MDSKKRNPGQLEPKQQAAPAVAEAKKEHRSSPQAWDVVVGWVRKSPALLVVDIIFLLILIFSLFFFFFSGPSASNFAGMAVGSWRGVTQGIAEGLESGKEAGLSAEDTQARISTKMVSSGNLEVLLVDLKITDLYMQGTEDKPDYAALLCIRGEGVFSVDLTRSQATYDATRNKIEIIVPEPTFEPYLDDSTLEVLAEYKRPLFDGSTTDGYTGYLNSRMQVDQKVQEAMSSMIDTARATARTQIELLARSVCGSSATVEVRFEGEEKQDG